MTTHWKTWDNKVDIVKMPYFRAVLFLTRTANIIQPRLCTYKFMHTSRY